MVDRPSSSSVPGATAPGGGLPLVRTIALMNQKGGVGKTTTTVNLAAAIARSGRRTLVIDLDPQAHATLHLGVDPKAPTATSDEEGSAPPGTVYDLLLDPTFPPEAAIRSVRPNLWIMPAETDLAALETELADQSGAGGAAPQRTTRLRTVLESLGDRFEFVLIDCPPSLGFLTLNALAAAREVFIPMQAHFLALQGVSKLLETVGLVARSVNPRLRVTGVVLCMHDTSTTHAREVVADMTAFFEQARHSSQEVPWRTARVLSPPIRRNIKLAECPSFGQTVFDYAPFCPGALDYQALAERVVADWDAMLGRRANGGVGSSAAPAPDKPSAPEIHVRSRAGQGNSASTNMATDDGAGG